MYKVNFDTCSYLTAARLPSYFRFNRFAGYLILYLRFSCLVALLVAPLLSSTCEDEKSPFHSCSFSTFPPALMCAFGMPLISPSRRDVWRASLHEPDRHPSCACSQKASQLQRVGSKQTQECAIQGHPPLPHRLVTTYTSDLVNRLQNTSKNEQLTQHSTLFEVRVRTIHMQWRILQ